MEKKQGVHDFARTLLFPIETNLLADSAVEEGSAIFYRHKVKLNDINEIGRGFTNDNNDNLVNNGSCISCFTR